LFSLNSNPRIFRSRARRASSNYLYWRPNTRN